MATKAIKEKKEKQVTKRDAIQLYNIIVSIKSGKLTREAMVKYIPLRIKLRDLITELNEISEEAYKQRKPDNYDTLKDEKKKEIDDKINDEIEAIRVDWMKPATDLDLKIFTIDEANDLIDSNNYERYNDEGKLVEKSELHPQIQELIYQYLIKE